MVDLSWFGAFHRLQQKYLFSCCHCRVFLLPFLLVRFPILLSKVKRVCLTNINVFFLSWLGIFVLLVGSLIAGSGQNPRHIHKLPGLLKYFTHFASLGLPFCKTYGNKLGNYILIVVPLWSANEMKMVKYTKRELDLSELMSLKLSACM